MPVELIVQQLFSVSGSIGKLHGFVKDDMASLLDKLGRLEYQAAVDALLDAKKSNNPEREITVAIACLRLALKTFYTNATDRSFISRFASGLKSALTIGIATPKHLSSAEGAVESCLLLAACYMAVQDRELAIGFLAKTRETFEIYAEARCEAAFASAGFSGTLSAGSIMREREIESLVEERKKLNCLCDEIAAMN